MSAIDQARDNTWSSQIRHHAAERPTGAAIRFEGSTTTWSALDERVDHVSDWLANNGITRGERVAIVMGNRPEFLEVVYACARIGVLAVPVNFRLTAAEIEFILRDSGSRVLFTDEVFVQQTKEAADVVGVDVVVVGHRDGVTSYDEVLSDRTPKHSPVTVAGTDPAAIMYTSGTTGHPKGAVLSHENFRATTDVVTHAWQMFSREDVVLAATPLFHIGGFGTTTGPIRLGTTLVILPSTPFDPSAVLDLIEAESVTATFMVPAQWQALVANSQAAEKCRSLRAVGWGAAPAGLGLLKRLSEVFDRADIVALFGQTEMSPITCVLFGEEAMVKQGSVGRPAFNVTIRVVDEEMLDVPPGGIGEIVYRGAGLMSGYWNNLDATEAAFAGGWFHSGDLVRRDDDGYVYVVDRAKDMIISGGENIYSAEVEQAVGSHPGVRDVAVVGRPDDHLGEAVVAVVEPVDPAAPPTLEAIVEHTSRTLASYKKPRDVVVVDVLPRNATGKVLKAELRARVGR